MDTLTTMRRKTYRNFLIVKNKLMNEKGYRPEEASEITHDIFENYDYDSTRTVRDYYDRILSREEFEAQYGRMLNEY
jgi:hypothetical protein